MQLSLPRTSNSKKKKKEEEDEAKEEGYIVRIQQILSRSLCLSFFHSLFSSFAISILEAEGGSEKRFATTLAVHIHAYVYSIVYTIQ